MPITDERFIYESLSPRTMRRTGRNKNHLHVSYKATLRCLTVF